jgi:hypothetical protein
VLYIVGMKSKQAPSGRGDRLCVSRWALLGAVALVTQDCRAQVVRWINPAGGLFSDGANWDAGHPPAATDNAAFGPNAAYTVTMGTTATVSNMSIDQGAITLNGPASLLIGPNSLLTGNLTIAGPASAPASLTIASGALRLPMAGNLYLATTAGTAASLTVEQGASLQWGTYMIGGGGTASMIVRGTVAQDPYGNGFIRLQQGSSLRVEGGTVSVHSFTTAGAPLTVINGHVNVDVWFGSGGIPSPITLTGSTLQGTLGGIASLNGTVVVNANSALNCTHITFGGVVLLDSATLHAGDVGQESPLELALRNGSTLTWNLGASFGGSPRIFVGPDCSMTSVTGTFSMQGGGLFHIDQGATLSFSNASLGATSNLEIAVDGASLPSTPMITCPDPMAIPTNLAGQLRVAVSHPNNLHVGDQFEVLRCGRAYTGTFSALVAPEIGGGRRLQLFLTPTSVFVQVVAGGRACWTADFDGDGDVATDADIEAFFACLAGHCCATCAPADFDGDGDPGTSADIESFFRVLAGGAC